ncbi:MAG: CotH kinase family protein [Candidatus Hydrogenedentes bacterium]|nr:CotH kinase family protein [Candidatus Hydrogenedentota bacterium]
MLGSKSDFMRQSCNAQFGGIAGRLSSFRSHRIFRSLVLCLLPSMLAFQLEAQDVDFDVSHRVIRQGETLTCSNLTVPGGLPIIGWEWDFGDATTSTDEAPSHVYAAPGQFTVSLTATTASDSVTETKTGFVIVLGPGAPVILNEYLASNSTGLQDEDGKYSDWVELYNATDAPVSLLGWALTDDELNPNKWPLPDVTVAPGGFLVVFASDKNRTAVPGELHTNFKLDADGEYVALVQDPSVPTIAYAYPAREQRTDVSYGLVGMDTGLPEPELHGFMTVPTPGAPNAYDTAQAEVTTTPALSHIHGHYDAPFSLSLTATEPGAEIYYTEDGSLPSQVSGTLYATPITVNANKVIRAIAYAPGYLGSKVATATYIIGASALQKSLPSLCVVGDPTKDLWAPDGIMVIDGGFSSFIQHGDEWERKISLEFFDPSGAPASPELLGFQEDCGIRVHGSKGRREGYLVAPTIDDPWSNYRYKISFRYYFRDEYGNSRLLYPLIPNANLSSLKQIVMRAGTDDVYNPFVKDELSRRLMAQMGNVTCRGTFIHFYLNGYFKGYFNPVERYCEDFFQQVYGSDTGWDVVKGTDEPENDRRELVEGDWDAWFALNDFAANNDLSDPTNYAAIAALMDIDNFIDYLIIECYGANFDWPRNNWYMARERSADPDLSRWRFYVWDMEMCYYAMTDTAEDFTVESYSDNPFHLTDGWTFLRAPGTNRDNSPIAKLYQALLENADFRAAWEARATALLGPAGVLGRSNVQAQFDDLQDDVSDVLLQQPMNTFIRDVWAVERAEWLLYWFAEEGLMPTYGNTDTDGDGLTGVQEIARGTLPNDPDSDDDGLTDGEEVNVELTDPMDLDSDDDLLPDGWEVNHSLDPNSDAGDDGASGDPDLDTYSNLDEYDAGTDPRSDGSFPGGSAPVAGFGALALTAAALLALGVMRRR